MAEPDGYDHWEAARQGYLEAADGEPLFPDAEPPYAAGWCYFHGIENPYSAPSVP